MQHISALQINFSLLEEGGEDPAVAKGRGATEVEKKIKSKSRI